MYNIFRESILAPKQIIKYHKKKGWFVFLYILILAIFLSIDVFVVLIANDNPVVNNETAQCEVVDHRFVCVETPIENQYLTIYDIPIYFLSDNQDVDDVEVDQFENILYMSMAVVVKDDTIHYRFDAPISTSIDASEFKSVSEVYASVKTSIVTIAIIKTIIQNIMILVFVILISTIPFIRFRKEIRYKKIFKMVSFAITPVALMMLLSSLLNLSTIFFFLLMFVGYRSVFTLQKELYLRSVMRQQNLHHPTKPDEDDIIDQEEDEE